MSCSFTDRSLRRGDSLVRWSKAVLTVAFSIAATDASTAGVNAASITVTVPANVRAGDVVIAVGTVRNNAITANAACTALRNDTVAGANMRQWLCYRVVTGASVAATTRGAAWLQGKWASATYTVNPSARASFGQYSDAPDVIYLREQD
jgi:hypothetical protein